MNISGIVKNIVKTNNTAEFTNLVNHLKYSQCKSDAEIRSILAASGLPPKLFDELKIKNNSVKKW